MKLDTAFLRSKVGRRIFMLFVVCALLPIAVLAIISFSQVTKQLQEQSQTRLRQASKALGMSTLERLTLLEAEMKMLASTVPTGAKDASSGPPKGVGANLEQRFEALEVITDDGRSMPLVRHIQNPPPLTSAQKQHMLSGKSVVSTGFRPDGNAREFMSCVLDPQNPKRGILLGEIDKTYLWSEDMLPPQTELCVLDEAQRVLSCTPGIPPSFRAAVTGKITPALRGEFEWSSGGKEFLASYWSIPMKYRYFTPGWTVVLSESKADVLAPLANFKATFPLVVLMALWVVLLLSIIQIRRSLVPLEKLQEGTRRIAIGDFDTRVTVTSKDEFEELATSFNGMTGLLGRQFNELKQLSWGALTAMARVIDAKSPWTSGHSERVTKFACELAAEMGYTEKGLDRIRRGGLLHDIGKIGTPPNILDKPGKLNPEELKKMREHTREGAYILEPFLGFKEILPIVLQHHEWVDGSGYPEGLVGEAISLDARIFAVADCFDALVSDRPYRAGLSRERVIEMIKEGSGRQFDPKVVEAFLRLMKQKEERQSKGATALAGEPSAAGLRASGPREEGFD